MTSTTQTPEVINFGKHKGTALTELPLNYVIWLLSVETLDKNLRKSLGLLPEIRSFQKRKAKAQLFSQPCFQRDNHYSKEQRIAYNNARFNI